MATRPTAEWKVLVGDQIRRRREQLGMFSRYQATEGLDLSESWWRAMEAGVINRDGKSSNPNPRRDKLRLLTSRLRWPDNAIDRLLAGETPDETWDTSEPAARTRDYNTEIAAASPQTRAFIDLVLDRERSQ